MEARLWPIDYEEHGVPREEIPACAEQHRAAAALPTQCTPEEAVQNRRHNENASRASQSGE